ncbi:uncharacterized protein TNCV_2947971 [Trichonephila clavipes]|nr:uncharacterized protein TNCV_2947971 [Trichonephila clavipes]
MLPVLEKKAVLEWCIKEGLIGSSYVCPKCGKSMELRERTECLNRIICDRKELELRAERDRENQRIFELQKLQFTIDTSTTSDSNMPKLELQKLLPIFDSKTTDITIYLNLFERQLTFLQVPIQQWVVYLVGLLPTEVSNLITIESFAYAQDYYKVKQILLKRFKLSAEKFRQMFSRHTKDPVKTWRDFYFDLQTYFDGWLKESKVTTLEELKDLIVVDQIKKTLKITKITFWTSGVIGTILYN